MQDWLSRLTSLWPGWAARPSRGRTRPGAIPATTSYTPRRPLRNPRQASQSGTASALIFLLVTVLLGAGLYAGLHWATTTRGGLLSSAVGASGILPTAAASPTRGLQFVTPTPQSGTAAATPSPESPGATPTPTRRVHVVEAGDSPAKIAQKYGVKVEDLMKVNNITDPRRLRVGQELVIPDSSDGAAATPTPAPHG